MRSHSADTRDGRRMPRLRFPLLKTLAILIFLGIVLYSVLWQFAGQYRASVVSELPEYLPAKRPCDKTNATALELERAASAVGIGIVPRGLKSRVVRRHVTDVDVPKSLPRYLSEELAKPSLAIVEPPQEIVEFLKNSRTEIDAIVTLLNDGVPCWGHDDLDEQGIPNLLGNIQLARLLTVNSLWHMHEGRVDEAHASASALISVSEAAVVGPYLIEILIGVADARMASGLMRKLPKAPPEFLERLQLHASTRQKISDSMDLELAYLASVTERVSFGANSLTADVIDELANNEHFTDGIVTTVMQPLIQVCMSYGLRKTKIGRDRLGDGPRCDDSSLRDEIPELSDSWWNSACGGWGSASNLLGTYERVARLEVDLEFTELILSANRRLEPGGRLSVVSEACPGETWSVLKNRDGSIQAELSRELDWGEVNGPLLPTRFGSAPALVSD